MAGKIHDEQLNVDININGNKAQKELGKLQQSQRDLKKEQELLRKEKAKLIAQGKKESDTYKNITTELKKTKIALKENSEAQTKLRSKIGITSLTTKQLSQEQKRLKAIMSTFTPKTDQWNKYNRELQKVESQLQKVRFEMKGTNNIIGRMNRKFSNFTGVLATLGIYQAIQKVKQLKVANAELSESQTDVKKTTGLSNREIQKLTKNLKNLDTRTPIIGLLGIAEEAGRLGKKGVKDITAFVKTADKIAVALGDDLIGDVEENVRLIGKLADNYQVSSKENVSYAKGLEKVGSAINEVSASGSTQAGFLVDYLKRLVGVSKQTNITAQDQIGYAAVLDESGQSVEVSGTTMSKVMFDMFNDTSTYAKIAGVDIKKFTKIMNTDANEAFLLFLEGLNGNNGGLQQMAGKLKDLGLKGARSISVLTALASETQKVRNKQNLANKALKENTSLTTEFQEKNNNLPALLEKITNHFSNLFTKSWISNSIKGVVGWFGKMVGAIKDVNEQFNLESKSIFESAKNNRLLANESENLLKKYQSLTKEGITPTEAEKKKLDLITLQLKDRLGDSVIAIDKETGSYQLNTEAVKEQIKLKRLTADEEAMTLVSRKKGAEDRIKDLKILARDAKKEFELRRKYFEETNASALKAYRTSTALTGAQKLELISKLDGYKELEKARKTAIIANGKLNTQIQRELDLTKKLNELNFTQKDVDNYFKTNQPKEGQVKFVGNTKFVFKNGKWKAVKNDFVVPDEEETAEEKRIKKSKARISEFIKKWEEDEEIRQSVAKFAKSQREEEEEIQKLELKFEKMFADSTNEIQVLVDLENIKKAEIQKVRDKWAAKRLKSDQENYKKLQIQDQKLKKALIKAEENLQKATKKAYLAGVLNLKSFFNEKSGIFKALFLVEKGIAANNVLIDTKKANAQIVSNLAIANMKAVAASPLTGGLPWTGTNSAIAAKETATNNLNAAIQLAGILGSTFQGFEDGLYDVTRTDGKKFKAPLGKTQTGLVTGPTFMDGKYLAGERSTARNPEMIIDDRTFAKLDPRIPKYIMDVHRGYIPGYEKGKYDTGQTTNKPVSLQEEFVASESYEKLTNLLERLEIILEEGIKTKPPIFGYEEIEKLTDLQKDIENSTNNGFLK